MRRFSTWILLGCLLLAAMPAIGATGRVIKVLPLFLDQKGEHTDSPSLYDRDSYQGYLRRNPEKRFGVSYDVHWKVRGRVAGPLKLRLELRGIAEGKPPREHIIETAVQATGWYGRWTALTLGGEEFKAFGEVTSWRVTLWEGDRLLGKEQSFLW